MRKTISHNATKYLITVLFALVLLIVTPLLNIVHASNYGEGNYGAGLYGTDTPTPSANPSFAPSSPANTPVCNDTAPNSAPYLVSAVAKTSTQIELTFSSAQDPVTYYALEFGTESQKYTFSSANIGSKGAKTYTIGSLSPNMKYYFRIRAGNGCMPGEWSHEISAKTKSTFTTNSLDFIDTTFDSVPNGKPTPLPKPTGKNTTQPSSPLIQEDYEVSVKVVNTKNEPVEGAKVTLHSTPKDSTTDKDGVAHFTGIEKGEHQLLIAYGKYNGEESIFLDGDVKEFKITVTIEMKDVLFSHTSKLIIGLLLGVTICLIIVMIKRNHRNPPNK